jgi:hypothetical protein
MSYHTPDDCGVYQWEQDAFVVSTIWAIPPAQVNLGIGLYAFGPNGTEPLYADLARRCPALAPGVCHCEGVAFASPQQALEVSAFVAAQGFRGAFPWAANYDAPYASARSAARWLACGLRNSSCAGSVG